MNKPSKTFKNKQNKKETALNLCKSGLLRNYTQSTIVLIWLFVWTYAREIPFVAGIRISSRNPLFSLDSKYTEKYSELETLKWKEGNQCCCFFSAFIHVMYPFTVIHRWDFPWSEWSFLLFSLCPFQKIVWGEGFG